MNTQENIRNGFWFSLGFGVAILMLTAGCFALTESMLDLFFTKGETQMSEGEELRKDALDSETPQEKQEDEKVTEVHLSTDAPLPTVGSVDFKEDCFALRAQIEETKMQTMLVFKEHSEFKTGYRTTRKGNCFTQEYHQLPVAADEMKANLMLSYRHLEDASMRLGKAVQAYDGGKSCYKR